MIRIRNWKRFQHFRDRRPPWIKLHRDVLDDMEWHELDSTAAKHLVMLWLIASEDESKEGRLPSMKEMAFRLRITEKQVESTVSKLSHWITQDDIIPISSGHQDVRPEESREETEKRQRREEDIATPPPLTTGSQHQISWDTTFSGITTDMVETWTKAYPACDIPQHLYRMDQWLLSNPTKAKKKNYYRFITNWLTRAQEKGGR